MAATPPPSGTRAVVFDYFNTLVEFAAGQVTAYDTAMADLLAQLFGGVDRERLTRIRNAQRRAPYANGYRENDLTNVSRELVRELYGRDPDSDELQAMLDLRLSALVGPLTIRDDVPQLLERLGRRFRLGVISNYPCGRAVRASITHVGLASHLDAVVVSGDIGYVKPHPLPFTTMLRELDVAAAETLYVGDNWLADVQGGKRSGLRVLHLVQYESPERFERKPGDHEPDAAIGHIIDVERYL